MRYLTGCATRKTLSILVTLAIASVGYSQVATYNVTFDSHWNPTDHPYAAGAHFSPLIGGLHDDTVSFWEPGGLATPGIERVAETGSIVTFRNEVLAAGSAAEVIFGNAVDADNETTVTLEVDIARPLMTLITMVAPSPDWFVGTHGLDLHSGGNWIDSLHLDLAVYDAGTDSGPALTSPNADTSPAEPIHVLPTLFSDTPPIGSFIIELVSVDGLTGDFDGDGDYSLTDIDGLVGAIASGGDSPAFDLTGDMLVNGQDLTAWLAEAGAAELPGGGSYLTGDANLDGAVDVADFNAWNEFKFTNDGGWSGGDFDANGATDVGDFNIWNENKFTASGDVSTVPEPSALWVMLLPIAAMLRRRR